MVHTKGDGAADFRATGTILSIAVSGMGIPASTPEFAYRRDADSIVRDANPIVSLMQIRSLANWHDGLRNLDDAVMQIVESVMEIA